MGRTHQSSWSTSPQRQLQATARQRLYRSPFYSACRTRSCGGASAYGVCFSRSCSVCRTCSCGGVHRSSTNGKLRSASAYTGSCRGTHFSRSYGVCRTSSSGWVHRSSASGKLCHASAYSVCCSSCHGTFLWVLQCMPQKLLWWSSSLQRQWRATTRRLQCLMHEVLSWNTFLQIQRCIWHQLLWWKHFSRSWQSMLLLSTSRLRRWSLPKQLFTRLMRRYALAISRSYPTWHVWVESACGDASGMAVHLLRVLQNLRGHGEGFRNVCATRRCSTRWLRQRRRWLHPRRILK